MKKPKRNLKYEIEGIVLASLAVGYYIYDRVHNKLTGGKRPPPPWFVGQRWG